MMHILGGKTKRKMESDSWNETAYLHLKKKGGNMRNRTIEKKVKQIMKQK